MPVFKKNIKSNFKRPVPRPVKNVTFTTEVKELNGGEKAVLLKDQTGAICGVYDTEENAKKAAPFVKRNLERGYIPYRWLRRIRKPTAQHLH